VEKSPVVFLAVPEFLHNDIHRLSDSFKLDPSILFPVELQAGEETFKMENLSLEMVLSGMLRIISSVGRNDPFVISEPAMKNIPPEWKNVPPEWIDYYRRFVLAVKPGIFHEFTGASIVKAENGDFDMALEISAVLEGLFPGSPGVLLNKALILESAAAELEKNGHAAKRENALALDAYETALAQEPVLPDTLFNAAFFFMRRRDFARAKDYFARYVQVAEESESSPENSTEFSAEKIREAKKNLEEIGGLDDSGFREAYDLINRGEDEKALLKIREYIEKHPKIWNGWFLLGWALRKQGRFKDGLESFKKALELGGGGSDLRNEMAICLMELSDFKAAKKELEQALRETSNDIKIISNLGVLALKSGDRDEAASYFRTVLELDGDDPLARHFFEGE
jgi:Tfp pilus assembly protein PilF